MLFTGPLSVTVTLIALSAIVASAASVPPESGTSHFRFVSEALENIAIRYVNNSGICETTPGVHTMSGYIDVGVGMSMWFWFFAARNASDTAPFTLWLNGGPGCSSMIGLFQENGPCTVNPDGRSTTINPYSWNTVSNMIYIDQPIGTGFSYGTDNVDSTYTAAPYVWMALQALFETGEFAPYQSREFIFATESYGGHYGPEFVTYFNQLNSDISAGSISGVPLVVSALMINNGWIDPLIQFYAYITFASNAPGYGPLVDSSIISRMQSDWNVCETQLNACYASGGGPLSDNICRLADNTCISIFALAAGDRDPYDLRQSMDAPFPPEYYTTYLSQSSVTMAIGAQSTYSECANAPFNRFETTGDSARTFLPQLADLANSRLNILIWAGDTDIICNWVGVQAAILSMDWYGSTTLNSTPLTNITLNGTPIAAVQNVDNFSFARVFAAGHEVPAFQPAAALEIFTQVINKQQLHSV